MTEGTGGVEGCGCFTCLDELDRTNPLPPNLSMPTWISQKRTHRFIVCGTCGNKRCPGAKDHRNACTHSNASGQKGSLYE